MDLIGGEIVAAARVGIAALVGLGAGLERQWSGHASGPQARFAGLRTFFLLGLLGGVGGLFCAVGAGAVGAALIAGGMALVVAAYVITTRRPDAEVDGTTEAAAMAVVALGALSGLGWMMLAAGAGSILVLILREKTRLHWLVRRVGEEELRAALHFAVLALVVLPLLPTGPFGGVLAIRPRALWGVVLFFLGLNFAGFFARRAVGAGSGRALTGILGGLLSSTAVTLEYSRRSRHERPHGEALAAGVVGACTVQLPRIVIVSLVLHVAVGAKLALLLLPPALVGAGLLYAFRRRDPDGPNGPDAATVEAPESPLKLRGAIQMALIFQVSLTLLQVVSDTWGTRGLFASAALLGLTDVDALTLSMSRLDGGVAPELAARAIAIGVISNTVFKSGLVAAIGVGTYRAAALKGLALLALASAFGFLLV